MAQALDSGKVARDFLTNHISKRCQGNNLSHHMAYLPFDTRNMEATLHCFCTAYVIASLPWIGHKAHFALSPHVLPHVLLTKEGRSGVGILMKIAEKVILGKEISKSVRWFQKTHKKTHCVF